MRLTIVTGVLLETQRFINVPMRFGERYLARERRELWVRERDGRERKWVIHTRVLPARRGHRIVLLVRGDWVVGLFNASTGVTVNYPRADPPFLLRGCDLLVVLAAALILPGALGAAGLALLLPAAVLYLVVAACGRFVWRWPLGRRVDEALAEVRRSVEVRPIARSERTYSCSWPMDK
jgi:hypothetical protein